MQLAPSDALGDLPGHPAEEPIRPLVHALQAKPVKVKGPRSPVFRSHATTSLADIHTARNSGEKRPATSASFRLAAPPLSWANPQVTCSPTGVAGISAAAAASV
jgi:hypothetical protein